jgi:hypothetical protein
MPWLQNFPETVPNIHWIGKRLETWSECSVEEKNLLPVLHIEVRFWYIDSVIPVHCNFLHSP